MLPNKIDDCLVAYSWLIRKYEVIAFLFCLYFGSISDRAASNIMFVLIKKSYDFLYFGDILFTLILSQQRY